MKCYQARQGEGGTEVSWSFNRKKQSGRRSTVTMRRDLFDARDSKRLDVDLGRSEK